MSMFQAIHKDLSDAIEDILDLEFYEASLSREELLSHIMNFYGAVTKAVHYGVITPEESHYLHVWLASQLEL